MKGLSHGSQGSIPPAGWWASGGDPYVQLRYVPGCTQLSCQRCTRMHLVACIPGIQSCIHEVLSYYCIEDREVYRAIHRVLCLVSYTSTTSLQAISRSRAAGTELSYRAILQSYPIESYPIELSCGTILLLYRGQRGIQSYTQSTMPSILYQYYQPIGHQQEQSSRYPYQRGSQRWIHWFRGSQMEVLKWDTFDKEVTQNRALNGTHMEPLYIGWYTILYGLVVLHL